LKKAVMVLVFSLFVIISSVSVAQQGTVVSVSRQFEEGMSVDAFNFPLNTFEEEDVTSLYRMEMQITTAEISNNQ
jgi:hypothetical protein